MNGTIDMLGGAIVMVSNQQRALEFYSQKIGFEVKENEGDDDDESSNRWIEVRPKNSGAPISLVDPDKEKWTPEQKEQAKKRIGTSTGMWFYAKDIQTTYNALRKKV